MVMPSSATPARPLRRGALGACLLLASAAGAQNTPASFIGDNRTRGESLLVLRLAVSSTGEYTAEAGGTAAVKATIATVLDHVNEVYGREYAIRFELIPNNDVLLFTNPATDPWPGVPTGGGCVGGAPILAVQEAVIDGAIGAANYDISHVFADESLAGGCAGGFKSGVSFPTIDIVRHEMGHQFSQSHTINSGAGGREADWAFELGDAGRSIQGGNSVANAHAASFHQLVEHLRTTAAGIGTVVPTGNTVPTVDAGPDRVIPFNTPFALTAVAVDPDSGDTLTYVWDQLDLGMEQSPPLADDSEGPLFSRLLPSSDATRTFPQLSSLLDNTTTGPLENLPSQPREINLRVTVNDNHRFTYRGSPVPASGVASDDIRLTVAGSGPFRVTGLNAGGSVGGGSTQAFTWDVAGTSSAPVSTANVRIRLSTDGGQSFPITLVNATPNDGTHPLTLPNVDAAQARIRLEAVDNVYFDISDQNFAITQNPALPGIVVSETGGATVVNETGQTDSYALGLLSAPAGAVQVRISAGAEIEISTDGVNFADAATVTLGNTATRTITVRGRFDSVLEGPHTATVTHAVSATADAASYPLGTPGKSVTARISDAQLPPVVGVDFDTAGSNVVPTNWVKFPSTRGQSASDLLLEDGTPTSIDIAVNSASCGFGGCSFNFNHNSGSQNSPRHVQNLASLGGVAVSRGGPVTAVWSGLAPLTRYRVYVFAHFSLGGSVQQTVTITGNGSDDPAPFVQTVGGSLQVNDRLSTNEPLPTFAKEVTSSASGTITVAVNAANETWLSGLALQAVPAAPASSLVFRNGFERSP